MNNVEVSLIKAFMSIFAGLTIDYLSRGIILDVPALFF